ncbi:MAG: UDP-3-O-acyl-N-acetylglucosamine deacetylase [Deltaproteobacteria bacterium]|nr:UDP-3-O-acyl-N-acetylglucosamine deacetylase [Deltaproteobacteria bacterium]MDL1961089.1 UDP-3-O-acyl-N-acetylglucosamine deacetylase [Deltaproteobacteria bacterium]
MINFQHTLKKPVKAFGIGLHSGEKISLKINPSSANTGICFVRSDLSPEQVIPARTDYVVDTRFATTIGTERGSVSTIEHLMAALFGAGVNNALIEIDGPEVPAMDGSAAPFLTLLQKAGLKAQDEPIRYIKIMEPIMVKRGDKSLSIEPSKNFVVSFEIAFEHPLIAKQRFVDKITPQTFACQISKARTFGFLSEVELLRENGFARGGSLENAVVVGDTSIYNSGGLRFSDEFVRHKVLDLIGDLYLLGAPILGKVKAVKSGHALHHVLTQELLNRPYAWEYVEHDRTWAIPSWVGQKDDVISAAIPA